MLLAAFVSSLWAADPPATTGNINNQDVPLTRELLKEIQKNPYIDESVQTTNGNVIGIYSDVLSDSTGNPLFCVIQIYDNVSRTKDYVALPWDVMRFDQQNRRIEIAAAAEQLRHVPRFDRARLERIKNNPGEIQKLQQSMAAMGGGSVPGTMGTQSGQGSSLTPPSTNDAQPQRGSVSMMYILAAVAVVIALGFFARRRT